MPRVLTVLALITLAGCRAQPSDTAFVARVGERLLTRVELAEALDVGSVLLDSAEAAERYVDQWIEAELLHAEAVRRGLHTDPRVRRLLEDSERSVLVSVLLDEVYRNALTDPTDVELAAYYESHRGQLALLQPYIRVRYLHVADADSAQTARRMLAATDTSNTTEWQALARRFARDPDASIDLAATFAPEARVLAHLPRVRALVGRLQPGETTPVVDDDGGRHVVQLVGRAPAGSVPPMEWIASTLRQRLQVDARKQLHARLVQDLRNDASSRELIERR